MFNFKTNLDSLQSRRIENSSAQPLEHPNDPRPGALLHHRPARRPR